MRRYIKGTYIITACNESRCNMFQTNNKSFVYILVFLHFIASPVEVWEKHGVTYRTSDGDCVLQGVVVYRSGGRRQILAVGSGGSPELGLQREHLLSSVQTDGIYPGRGLSYHDRYMIMTFY